MNILRIALLVGTCCTTIPAAAQEAQSRLLGKVVDTSGSVIANALVLIHWDSSGAGAMLDDNIGIKEDLSFRTDSMGRFSAVLPPGFYDVFVASEAFTPMCGKIRVKAGKATNYNVKLKLSPIVSAEIGEDIAQ
jgi:hypothetical protein